MVCNGSHVVVLCDLVPKWVTSVCSLFWVYVSLVPRFVFQTTALDACTPETRTHYITQFGIVIRYFIFCITVNAKQYGAQ
jgi:hypothetical protein